MSNLTQYTKAHYLIYPSILHSIPKHTPQHPQEHYTVYPSTLHSITKHTTQHPQANYTVYPSTPHSIPRHTTQYTQAHGTTSPGTLHSIPKHTTQHPQAHSQHTQAHHTASPGALHSIPKYTTQHSQAHYTVYPSTPHSIPRHTTQCPQVHNTVNPSTLNSISKHKTQYTQPHHTVSPTTLNWQWANTFITNTIYDVSVSGGFNAFLLPITHKWQCRTVTTIHTFTCSAILGIAKVTKCTFLTVRPCNSTKLSNRVLSRVIEGKSLPPNPPASPTMILLALQYISNYIAKTIQMWWGQCTWSKYSMTLYDKIDKIVYQNASDFISAHIHFKKFPGGGGACPWTPTGSLCPLLTQDFSPTQ